MPGGSVQRIPTANRMPSASLRADEETQLEWVACDLCGADDAEPELVLRDLMIETATETFRLVRCRRCGLRYLNPRPTAAALDSLYPDSYAPFARHGVAAWVKAWQTHRQIDQLWRLLAPPTRVLDLGCATGELLQMIRERGNPNVLGVEPSPFAAETARRRYQLDVCTGDLHSARLGDASADVVLMSHVIEHLPSPSATLDEIGRILSPHGVLVLWLPNAASWAARFWGRYWIGYDVPRHLYDFTPATLAALLKRHGFVVHEVRHESIGLEWSWGLRLLTRSRQPDSALDRALTRFHPALTAALTPISALATLNEQAGRIRVLARCNTANLSAAIQRPDRNS